MHQIKLLTLSLIFLFGNSIELFSQSDFEERVREDYVITCDEIRAQVVNKLVNEYLPKDQLDSAKLIAEYWLDKCGPEEIVLRTNILLDISLHQFKWDNYFNDSTSFTLILGMYREKHPEIVPEISHFGGLSIINDYFYFDVALYELAIKAIKDYERDEIEWLICKHYTDPQFNIFEYHDKEPFAEIGFDEDYNTTKTSLYKYNAYGLSIGMGKMFLTDDLKDYNSQLLLDIGGGWYSDSYGIWLEIEMGRFKKEPTDDIVDDRDTLAYISYSLKYIHPVIFYRRNALNIVFGVSNDILKSHNDETLRFDSFGLNLGLSMRLHIYKEHFLEIESLYTIRDFSQYNFNYSGNSFSLQFSWGMEWGFEDFYLDYIED